MNLAGLFKKKEQKLDENGNPPPPPSAGEKWFNGIIYTGMNYWLNLGISLVVTDYFLHGKGAGFFKNGVDKVANGLQAAGVKRSWGKWFGGQALGTFSLNSGGNILLVPTKLAEDNKRNIVHWLNEKLGVDQTAPDGHKETPDEIYIEQEQPKQSWMRMIGRRALGWSMTTSTGMALDTFVKRKYAVPQMVDGELVTHKYGQDIYTDWTKKVVNSGLSKIGGQSIVENATAQRYIGFAALDWIYTMITSTVMHMTNGAGKMKAPHEIGDDAAPPATVPIGDSLKPGEHLEPVVVPKGKHAADILRAKDKDEGYAASISRQAEAAAAPQLGA